GGPVSIFHPTFLILVAGVSNAFLAGDLFNLYVGFEILLTSSYVLLTMGGTAQRIRAGITYVVVSVLSSVVFLIAIAMIYAATGTVN
ncbi:proton-conducting transporter membrane subunit, partial [Escherichia coli]|nr:proton-conducting transporter membrane subunit [Escherichia coli]